MPSPLSTRRWSAEQAWRWYDAQPFLLGANFIPSTAVNQLEMWQADTFDRATIGRELGWAAGLGMNVMRVYLHDLLWEQDAAGFCARIDEYLALGTGHGMRTLFVVFDDCWNDTFALGRQPAPKPATHNSGWVQSPGKRSVNDPALWPRLEHYVMGLLARFRDDPRIIGWDLYNEPGNGTTGDASAGAQKQGVRSLPLLTAAFEWARRVPGLTQPLTCAPWSSGPDFEQLNAFSLANSDVITFHNYSPPQALGDQIRALQQHGRPMICSEYMCRGLGSSFEYCLPILARHRVGAINWGLVSGKTQTIYPWGWSPDKGVPDVWFHDIFNGDGTMLYPREERVLRSVRQ